MEECVDIDNETTCGICYAEFLDIEDLKLHINQYHLNDTSKYRYCKFCSRIFSDIQTYLVHIRNEHLKTMHNCKYCTRVYDDRFSLSRHEKKHKSAFYYPKVACSHCIKVFRTKKELENHEYEKHSNSSDGIMLQYCYPELSSVINMNVRRFLKAYHENYDYKCVVCNLTTPNVNIYIDHLFTKTCKSFACNTCSTVYKLKSQIKSHCKTHLSKGILIKKCPKCNKNYHPTKWKAHVKTCTSMRCVPCNVSFDTVDKFANHVTTHSERNKFRCEICKYCRRPLVGLAALEKHIERTHKPNMHLYKYRCIYCNIVFKHPKLLFGHFFSKHKDINPYICKICNKDFRIRKNFTLHIKLDHKSVGFVEFDSNFHVFFTDKKTKNPFQPRNLDCVDLPTQNTETRSLECVDVVDKDVLAVDEKNDVTSKEIDTLALEDLDGESNLLNELIIVTNTDLNEQNKIEDNFDNEKDIFSDHESLIQPKDTETYDKNEKPDLVEIEVNVIDDKVKENNCVNLVNVNSDFMAETEADQTETDLKMKTRGQKRKLITQTTRIRKRPKPLTIDASSDESDTPLSKIAKKKSKRIIKRKIKRRKSKNPIVTNKKMKFICYKCNRNCYTYQNYHRHMSLHMKKSLKVCVKCFGKFKTKDELNEHMKVEHSGSRLTETLKKILNKRKINDNVTPSEPPSSVLFLKTIQKVPIEESNSRATIVEQNDQSPVKKFLENFKPDSTESVAKKMNITNCLTIKLVTDVEKVSTIKMVKFKPEPLITSRPQLRKPVRFKEEITQDYKVSVKLVNSEHIPILNFDNEVTVTDLDSNNIDQSYYEDPFDVDRRELIPDIGEEISLDSSDTRGKVLKKTIVLKDVLAYNNVRIGHLAPKAPFYKIVKIDDVLQKTPEPPKLKNITLPNGKKLVNVNPLAHLLGDSGLKELSKLNSTKHYKPKTQDFGKAIVKAMSILDETPVKRTTK